MPATHRHRRRNDGAGAFVSCCIAGLLLGLCSAAGLAADSSHPPSRAPTIALIVDDLGDKLVEGERAVALPGPIACAFLPRTPYAAQLAERAHVARKEVMLHLPMQSVEARPLGPDGLTLDMTRGELVATLSDALDSLPHVSGVNNHMGSLLTRHPGHMLWVMQELRRRGDLFFIDSRTTAATVAQQIAAETGVPNLRRNVFLDADRAPASIRAQFARLLAIARREGIALGIGHPYPETLAFLEQALPQLSAGEHVKLVSVRALIAAQQRRPQVWQASLSH